MPFGGFRFRDPAAFKANRNLLDQCSLIRQRLGAGDRAVDLRLADLRRLLADRKITLKLTEAARHQLLLTGYDRQYGARPLKRAIQRLIQDPLAIKILDGEVLNGDVVRVDADPLNNQLRFEVVERSAEAPRLPQHTPDKIAARSRPRFRRTANRPKRTGV